MINNLIMLIHVYFLIAGFHKFKAAVFELCTLPKSKTHQTSLFQQIFVCSFSFYSSLPYTCVYNYVVTHQQIGAPSTCALRCGCS